MRAVFRAEGSSQIGVGHLMRTFALAQAMREEGHEVTLMSSEAPPSIIELWTQAGCTVVPSAQTTAGSAEDAQSFLALAQTQNADWAVADGYVFGLEFQKTLTQAGQRLLSIDDLTSGDFFSNLVVNANLNAETLCHYQTPTSTRLLLGIQYAFLRKDFRTPLPPPSREISETPKKLLITMGGSDSTAALKNLLGAISNSEARHAEIQLLMGMGTLDKNALLLKAESLNLKLECISPGFFIRPILESADLVISAAGTTTWELAILGTPMILGILADNQQAVHDRMSLSGAALGIGRFNQSVSTVSTIDRAWSNPKLRTSLSAQARLSIDHRGVERVLEAMKAML